MDECHDLCGFTKVEMKKIFRQCVNDLIAIKESTSSEDVRLRAIEELTSISLGQLNHLNMYETVDNDDEDDDDEEDWK